MALTKRNYVSGETVITAENLNEIQDSIIALEGKGLTKEEVVDALEYTPAKASDIPTADISDNTAARHSHGNKDVLDNIAEITSISGGAVTGGANALITKEVLDATSQLIMDEIPSELKNPYALTFTGASSGTYDGSSAVTINIPNDGADGKSAYQYAQDGGYTGTEVEFAAKLAQEIPSALPNPNALTFTGAVTGSYDGSAPLEVEIPSGGYGGGGISAFEKIGTIDLSTMAASNLGVDFTVTDVTEIVLIWTGMTNTTTSNSFLILAFNSGVFYNVLGPRTGKAGTPLNGYTYLKILEGVGLLPFVSPGATTNTNYSPATSSATTPYNLLPVKEKIQKILIRQPSTQYYADAGIVEVYVR